MVTKPATSGTLGTADDVDKPDGTSQHAAANTAGRSALDTLLALRFPLLPRPRPVCRSLADRLARVRSLAHQATQDNADSLNRAAQAHNFAALIASDCGNAALARSLCWRQHDAIRAPHAVGAAQAKLTLQPLINLARLRIRAGDGDGGYEHLLALFQAVKTRQDTLLGARSVALSRLVRDADHREVVQWLWTILLADGTRALTAAGRWPDALDHVERHRGIGQRLLDGRQVAIIAHATTGDTTTALNLLAATDIASPWERAIASCLGVACRAWANQPSSTDSMVEDFLALHPPADDTIFYVRLGLTVHALADQKPRHPALARTVHRHAISSGDAYASRDILTAEPALAVPASETADLAEVVNRSGLDADMPAEVAADLLKSVDIAEAVMRQATARSAQASTERRPAR